MGFSIKVKMHSASQIIRDHGLDENGPVQAKLLSDFDRFMDPYIPKDNGPLKNTKTYPNKHSIKYTSPYAHYMYKGKLMLAPSGSSWAREGEKKHYTNVSLKYQGAPKRGAEWDKRMWNDRKNDILRDLQNVIKRGGK